ncbi:MAG: alpha/beta hydrolase [Sphingomonadaceae bacterium]
MTRGSLALALGTALFALAPASAQLKPAELPRLMTARSVQSLPAAAPAETIRYGEGESQVVELFLPRGAAAGDPLPVVVMVHGGCWQKAVAGRELIRPAAGAFVERGYAVWSVGYRRIDEEGGGYPGTFADVGQAIDLLRSEAAQRNLDPARVVFWGHSAGAHLALWAAGRHRLPASSPLRAENPLRPRGVVSVGGLASLKDWEREIRLVCGDDTVPRLAPGDGPERFSDTSPDLLLPLGVPLVLLHGVYDAVAYPAMGLRFAQAARAAGDRAEVQPAPVAGHFEPIAPGTPAFAQALAAVEAFARLSGQITPSR